MSDFPPVFTQLDISATSITPGATGSDPQARQLLVESLALQQRQIELLSRQCELLTELVSQVSLQQRQRAAELKAWKEANPELAHACRQAADSLAKVHTEFLAGIAAEAFENAENYTDSEYALGEFIDRYGPRLAHFNGVLQLFAQLGAPPANSSSPAGEG
jgi:hypothetical protein